MPLFHAAPKKSWFLARVYSPAILAALLAADALLEAGGKAEAAAGYVAVAKMVPDRLYIKSYDASGVVFMEAEVEVIDGVPAL